MAAVGLVEMDCGRGEERDSGHKIASIKGSLTHTSTCREKIRSPCAEHLPTDNVEIALIGKRTAALDAERPQCTSTERCDGGITPAGDGSCRRGEHHGGKND